MHLDELLAARRQLRNIGAFLGRPRGSKSIGLLFPGHGSQYLDVIYQYWDTDPEVRKLIQDVDKLCEETFDEALSNVIFRRSGADGSALSEPWAMQLAIFTASIVQSRKLAPLVPEPAVVLGHSLGEYAALVAAGALSVQAGFKAVASRAEVVSSLPREQWGGMVAVRVAGSDDERILKAALNDQSDERVVEAIRNSPSQRIVAGTLSGLDELEVRLQNSGLKTKRLPISHAYHSPLLHSCVAPLKEALLNLDFREPSGTVVISSVTGAQVTDFRTEPMAEMLATQLVRPFDFTTALRSFRQAGGAEAVEVGPNSLLTGLVDRNEESIMVVPFDSPRNDPKTNEAKIAMYIDSIGCESVGASVETSEHSQDDVLNVVAAASGYPLFALDISDSISTLGLTPSGAGNVQTALKTLLGGENDFSATAPFYEFAASAEPGVEPVGADELVGRLVESFAEATGYPVEVIEPDLDLEADLGIDSVKQAEVVASVSESVGVATGDSDFAGVSTVREFASRLASLQFGDVVGQLNSVTMIPAASAASAASAEPGVEPVDFGTEKDHAGRYILRAVPRELPQRESSVPFYSGLRILVVGSDDERITADMASQLEAGGAEVITLQFVESEPVGGLGQKKFVQKVSDFDEVRAEALHREIGKIEGARKFVCEALI
ncbi:acyltransferase domain-containing protein [Corynebacterium glaucum]|uniref:acyltransferase domain-containing protein n=1 Tax=Corynebacterium glaucum TaxID=187491 RepID=UPI0031DBD73D